MACLWLWISAAGVLAAVAPVPAHQTKPDLAVPTLGGSEMPPLPGESLAVPPDTAVHPNPAAMPSTLARTHRSRATPSPSPGDDASPTASPAVTANQGTPVSTAAPSDEFTGKYEAAYAKFLEKNYPETLSLLDEADKIQPGQAQSINLRFKTHYALGYLEYRKQNYPGAMAHLDDADRTQKNAESYNLRGLIFSRQHNYDQAEAMFRKAATADPTLWAAKFNYAELPFNRGNYPDARTRFEELFSQTDAAKQPREAELTQYKVFLTLLLEGKVEAASTFMDHLTFSGATPARYFCNAALNFRAGSVDKAKNWIDDAKKEYPPQLVAIFVESFYRLGWLSDPANPPGTLVAQATPADTPAVTASGTPSATPAAVAALSSPSPAVAASTPIIVAAASPTPTPLAAASVTPKPTPAIVLATATPRPTASATPAVVIATPAATPRPTASVAPAVVVATPTATPRPTALAVATPVATPVHTVAPAIASPAPVVVVATPAATPARTVALASATPTPVTTPTLAQVTPAPTVVPSSEAAVASTAKAKRKTRVHFVLLLLVLGQSVYYVTAMRSLLLRRKENERRAAARKRAMVESSK